MFRLLSTTSVLRSAAPLTRPILCPRQSSVRGATEGAPSVEESPSEEDRNDLPKPSRGFYRKDLINYVYENYPHFVSKANAETMVDLVFEGIMNGVVQSGKLTVAGFGTFRSAERNERNGRNPQTGEPITIPAKVVPAFKAGKVFKDAVQKGEHVDLLS